MIKNFVIKNTIIPKLAKGLDVYALRQKVISNNIANVQTSGYQRKDVKFEEHLQGAISKSISGSRTDNKHLSIGKNRSENNNISVEEDRSDKLPSGVNNVDIEDEIIDQVKNEIRFLYGSRMINKSYTALRASIKGRFDR